MIVRSPTDAERRSVLLTNERNAKDRHCRIGFIDGKTEEPMAFWWALPGSRLTRALDHPTVDHHG